jgi:hypothetical protein
MSKQNKANKNNYSQAGRLTPDDMAREQQKMPKAAALRTERVRAQEGPARAAKAPRAARAATRPRTGRGE